MSQDSPVAKLLIQKIYLINEQVLKHKVEYDDTRRELEIHLKKAEQLGSLRYQAETLNALGNLENIHYKDPVPFWEPALERAETLTDVDLRLKLYNNLGSTYTRRWQLDRATTLLQKGLDLAQSLELRSISALYLHTNLLDALINMGNFSAARPVLEYAWSIARNVDLMQYTAFVYGQIMFGLYQHSAKMRIMFGEEETALLNLRLALEIAEQLEHDTYLITAYLGLLTYYILAEDDPEKVAEYEKGATKAGETVPEAHDYLRIGLYLLRNKRPEKGMEFIRRANVAAADEEDSAVTSLVNQLLANTAPEDLRYPA